VPFIDEGNSISRTFVLKNDKDLITAQYRGWEAGCTAVIKPLLGAPQLAQFQSARGNGTYLLDHNIEGDAVYALLQAKITVLNNFLVELRR
jgi:hypothetical protein